MAQLWRWKTVRKHDLKTKAHNFNTLKKTLQTEAYKLTNKKHKNVNDGYFWLRLSAIFIFIFIALKFSNNLNQICVIFILIKNNTKRVSIYVISSSKVLFPWGKRKQKPNPRNEFYNILAATV
jgi:hypothetical protein